MVIQCPSCHKNILDVADDGTPRLRSKVVLFTSAGTVAQCPSCKEKVTVPLSLQQPAPAPKRQKPLVHYINTNNKR